jgi:[ribosomal protein S5]-alanine N-acetyltransferase
MTLPTPTPLPQAAGYTTERLLVRPIDEADLGALLEVNADPEVTRYLPYETWLGEPDARAWFERMRALEGGGDTRQFVLADRAGGTVVGSLLLFRLDNASRRIEVGYVLGRRHWGRGLMREALAGTCGYAFGTLGLRRVEAWIDRDNTPSNTLVARLGFQREGTLRERTWSKGRVCDMHVWGLLAHEWAAR